MSENVYQEVVDVTTSYLGPAAERFITRQIQNHLGKEPDELTKEDVVKLTDKVKVAIAMLTDDKKLVDEYAQSLLSLSN